MNSKQLFSILHSKLGNEFYGVFPSDGVPKTFDSLPAALITNTDPSDLPGSHWLALYFDSNKEADYFDSFGRLPKIPGIIQLLSDNKYCNHWNHNITQIQGLFSSVCGHYCTYFLMQRSKGVSMSEIVEKFDRQNFEENDILVTEWVNSNFDLNTETYDTDFMLNQICRALKQ